MSKKFCHLHLHNQYSVLDGIGTSAQYAALAVKLGQSHIALTNHGNVDGAIDHQTQCEKAGITPLIGCELYIVDDITRKEKGEKRYHLTVLVENQTGWQNLLKILSIANLDGFYYRPRVDFRSLLGNLDGLVILSGCSSSFLNMGRGEEVLEQIIDQQGPDRVFLEVMPFPIKEQIDLNKRSKHLAAKYGIKIVATNDCHYPGPEASYYQEVLLAIQSKKKMTDKDRWKFNVKGLFLRSYDEMFDAFWEQSLFSEKEISEYLDNTMIPAQLCEGFRIKKREPDLPNVGTIGNETGFQALRRLVLKGKARYYPEIETSARAIYDARINEELRLISRMGFERYFLSVWDLINWCRENDIMVGPGRGSVGGSLIAFLIGITAVDPIKYNLVFSRFISPDRIDLPDIDMDFEDHKRSRVKEYLQQKYGTYNVVGLSTFMTMKGKGILRDVSRAFDVPLKEVDLVAKAIDETIEHNAQVKESCETILECKNFKRKYPQVVEVAIALEGQIRGVGQHAAAVCVSSSDLREGGNCNIAIRSGQTVANWDKDNAEFMGLVKLDILGLSALSVLSETRLMVKENHGAYIDYDSLPLDDPAVYREINKGNTVGAFQIGAAGLSKFCQKLRVDSFELLVASTALYRPGPLHSGMAEEFVDIKNKRKKVKKIHPIYDKITEKTFGIIVYQEQVMSVVNQLSGIDMASCDKIRKLMAKSKGAEALDKYKELFLEGCKKKDTLDKKQAIDIWETVSTFGKYGFNQAHSVEYSLISYWDMWLKTYYPNEFLACSLTFGSKDQTNAFLREANRLGLFIRLPKIGVSKPTSWVADIEKNLIAPFIAINGIGESAADAISKYKHQEKKQTGFFKSLKSTDDKKIPGVNKTVTGILKEIGAFEPFGEQTREERNLVKKILGNSK